METSAVLQLTLPFEGVQDRIRAAAELGKILILAEARSAMKRFEISDILIVRALKRTQLCGRARPGNSRGEWRCSILFNVKGFRPGGTVSITVAEGRVFVENIRWDK